MQVKGQHPEDPQKNPQTRTGMSQPRAPGAENAALADLPPAEVSDLARDTSQ